MRPPGSGVLATALRLAVGGGVLCRPQMASPPSPSRRKQQSPALSRSALRARDALVLEHLPLADAIASAAARRLFPLVEREDLLQVAREALVRSAPRCRAGEPAAPYLRSCISGALQHHLRDRVRLVRVPKRVHEAGDCPLGHSSLDASFAGGPCLLDQLPAAQATALRLTVLEGLSLRQAATRLEISAMSVQRAQKKALEALRQQLAGGGCGRLAQACITSCQISARRRLDYYLLAAVLPVPLGRRLPQALTS
jgi:RNA polymerase sigma factor (sigma-70 family)